MLSISILSLAVVKCFSGDFVNDDGFPWPGSLPPGWEVEWEDDSA